VLKNAGIIFTFQPQHQIASGREVISPMLIAQALDKGQRKREVEFLQIISHNGLFGSLLEERQ
jgi:hypothetical protein